jgi:GT2 family glycosyltransferase
MLRAVVLVLNSNGKANLGTCLSSVLAQTEFQDRAYLADNGSVGDSVKHARERCLVVKVICFERNLGLAEAYNCVNRSVESNQVDQGMLDV